MRHRGGEPDAVLSAYVYFRNPFCTPWPRPDQIPQSPNMSSLEIIHRPKVTFVFLRFVCFEQRELLFGFVLLAYSSI